MKIDKQKAKRDIFDFEYLDEEEKELIESIEEALDKGELKSIITPQMKKDIEEAARNTPEDYHGDKIDILTITVDSDVSKKLKYKAKKQGVRYQDLASSVLQKFANS